MAKLFNEHKGILIGDMNIARKIFFTLLAILSISGGFYLGAQELVAVPLFAFASGGLFLMIGFLSEIKFFKASTSGIEAETREVVKEAKETITELRKMALLFSRISLKGIKSTGRFGTNSNVASEEMKDSLVALLKELGAADDKISGILLETWYPYIEGDYISRILGHGLPKNMNPGQHAKRDELLKRRSLGENSSPVVLREFMTEISSMSVETDDLLTDYDHFLKTREVRNPSLLDFR